MSFQRVLDYEQDLHQIRAPSINSSFDTDIIVMPISSWKTCYTVYLFVDFPLISWLLRLCSCDLEIGLWSYKDVNLHQASHIGKLLLVVSLGHLFVMLYTGFPSCPNNDRTAWETFHGNHMKKKLVNLVSIWEIILAKDMMKET